MMHGRSEKSSEWGRAGWLPRLAVLGMACLLLCGCAEKVDNRYGVRVSPEGSVNGTGVLADMFDSAGHQVRTWRRLSPRLNRCEVIVWVPDDGAAPSEDCRTWLENWLVAQPGRSVIYVGRDWDGAVAYWKHFRAAATPSDKVWIDPQLAEAQSDFDFRRSLLPAQEDRGWFQLDSTPAERDVRTLDGDRHWLTGVDPKGLQMQVHTRFTPPPDAQILLESEGDCLVSRQPWGESQLLVVTNGSFLLNVALVNREHRKLAGKLVSEIGTPGKTVVFLESDMDGLEIFDEEPEERLPTALAFLGIWPMSYVLLHLAALGVIFCFARWPIFGLPRPDETGATSDFGEHVTAVGEMLGRSGDLEYAAARVAFYKQNVKVDPLTLRHPGTGGK